MEKPMTDLYNYTINHTLSRLFGNACNNPNKKDVMKDFRAIRNSVMISESYRNANHINNSSSKGIALVKILFKFRCYLLLSILAKKYRSV